MKEFKINQFSIKRVAFSRFEDQLLIILYTKNDVKVYKFVSPVIARWRKALFTGSLALLLLVGSAIVLNISLFSSSDEVSIDVTNENDENLKNTILKSGETDYSEPETSTTLKIQQYTVKQGDTLSEIAREFGVSAETICGSSGLVSLDVLQIGQILKIPNKEGILYKAGKGDSMERLAKKYNVSLEKIRKENPELTISLAAGMEVFIPDAKPQNIISGFMWPVPRHSISSGFGWRRHPLTGGRHFHTGLDIRANYQSVRASKYGKVTYAGWMGGYGYAIVIAHPGGFKTLYGHLSNIWVKTGQYVKQGQAIARSGNTGNSTGPHLHFELIKSGTQINPYKFLR